MKIHTLLALFFISGFILLPSQLLAQEVEDELKYRKWRVTLFPPISTNGLDAPNYTARYSVNILGGYHGALDGAEVGGLINYNKYYAHGFQIAGLANITGGDMAGLNFAGFANISKDEMAGLQFAGVTNITGSDLEGVQGAGFLNISGGTTTGIQFAGVGNIAQDDMEGIQIGGVFNATTESISGLQVAGLTNIARQDIDGLQTSGLFNFAGADISGLQLTSGANIAVGDIDGLMIAGAFNLALKDASGVFITGGLNYAQQINGLAITGGANIARDMSGLQIAGINLSRNSEGLQVGLINLAQEFDGMPIGLISLYGNGRKNIDMRYSDGGFTDIGINLGTYRVYNMAILGYNTHLDRDIYRVGLAVGLEKNIQESFPGWKSNSVYVNQEISMLHHFENEWDWTLNRIYSYKYHIGKRFGSGFSIYAGPSFNMQISRVPGAEDYTWYSLWSPSAKGRDYRFWVGFSFGVRLFKQKNMPLFREQFQVEEGWKLDW